MSDYIEHLEQRLAHVDSEIERARGVLQKAGTETRMKALDELGALRIRHDDLVRRIAEAKEKGSEAWSALHTGFQEEADGLKDAIESILTRTR